jgi:hypothetical protein
VRRRCLTWTQALRELHRTPAAGTRVTAPAKMQQKATRGQTQWRAHVANTQARCTHDSVHAPKIQERVVFLVEVIQDSACFPAHVCVTIRFERY